MAAPCPSHPADRAFHIPVVSPFLVLYEDLPACPRAYICGVVLLVHVVRFSAPATKGTRPILVPA